MLFNMTEREVIIGGACVVGGGIAVGVTAGVIHANNKKRIEAVTGMKYADIINQSKIQKLESKMGTCKNAKTAESYQKRIDKLEKKLSNIAAAVSDEPVVVTESCDSPALDA